MLVADNGHHIATGFAGTPYVCDALTSTRHLDDAYRLLLQRECPSWLYPVTMGATTIWERWDSMLPDGTINPGQMTSFNHYALGAVADWMHRIIGGLTPAEPGYRTIRIAPRPGGGLTWAETSLISRLRMFRRAVRGRIFHTNQVGVDELALLSSDDLLDKLRAHLRPEGRPPPAALACPRRGRSRDELRQFDFELSDADMAALGGLDAGVRLGPDPDEQDARPRSGFSNTGGRWAPESS